MSYMYFFFGYLRSTVIMQQYEPMLSLNHKSLVAEKKVHSERLLLHTLSRYKRKAMQFTIKLITNLKQA